MVDLKEHIATIILATVVIMLVVAILIIAGVVFIEIVSRLAGRVLDILNKYFYF